MEDDNNTASKLIINDEIKLILKKLKIVSEEQERGLYLCDKEHSKILLDYITNLQQKYDRALEDSVKETHKLMEIRKYLKDNEREYGSLEDNEKIILGIIEGKYDER